MSSIILKDGVIVTMEGVDVAPFQGSVAIIENSIALVTSNSDEIDAFIAEHPSSRVVDCRGRVIMPGLINCHCHVSMTLQRGLADDISLMEWLNDWVWPFEAKQSEGDIEAGARLGIAEMLLGGVTTFVDMYFAEHRVAQAVEDMGIRALLTECFFDATIEKLEGSMSKLIQAAKGSSRIMAGVAPHAPYTCSVDVLKQCGEFSQQHNLPLHIHLLESPSETEMVEQRYGCPPTQHLLSSGVIEQSTLLAHCIQLQDDDFKAIKDWGASVVHNPQSNMKISSGIAPVTRLLSEGINVTLGSDGACSNNDLDMWEELRSAVMLQRVTTMNPLVLPAYQALEMVTVNGAKALGMEGKLGVIKQGALADIIVVNMNKPHLQPLHNVISTLLYCVKSSDIETTIVDGRILVEGGELLGVDVGALIEDATLRAKKILRELRIISQ